MATTTAISSKYQAVVLPKLSKTFEDGVASLQLATLDSKPLGANDVRVKIMATALNFFDLLITTGPRLTPIAVHVQLSYRVMIYIYRAISNSSTITTCNVYRSEWCSD
jgi:hypothetical protein